MQQHHLAEQRRWFESLRQASDRVFVGLDHHSRQVTVAAASGAEFISAADAPSANWMPASVFEQDGLGYPVLIDWLESRFPGASRDQFTFVAEPTFAKPLSQYLARAGFNASEIKWVRTPEVAPYRKAKGIGKAGKNDIDDARAMAMMAFEAATSPFAGRGFLPGVRESARADGIRRLAAGYWRLTAQSVNTQNQIWDLVVRLFPECWRVWNRAETVIKPDGTRYQQRKLALFEASLPMEILAKFPGARAIAEAEFDGVWAVVGRTGRPRRLIRQIVDLAKQSAAIDEPLDAVRLQMLIREYQDIRSRLGGYLQGIEGAMAEDPVLHSLGAVYCLGAQQLGVIVGALGDVSRFPDFDAVKKYLNIAPVPMPHTGTVDPDGRPVQIWRFPANTYQRRDNHRRLVYEIPGRQDVRCVLYLWFQVLVTNAQKRPDDPFVKLYLRLKAKHEGKKHWFGTVRWKVAAKLVGVIFHCLRHQEIYDPARVSRDMKTD